MGTSWNTLQSLPPGVEAATGLVRGLDQCLLLGFGRLGPQQVQLLQALQRSFGGTSFGDALGQSIAALSRLEFAERHFLMIAAARLALQGAVHDALTDQLMQTLGRRTDFAELPASNVDPRTHDPLGESCRAWLLELALAGFKNLGHETIAPFGATLEHLTNDPVRVRSAALLLGFQRELLHSLPISAMASIPAARWADLWMRGFLGSLNSQALDPKTESSQTVSGRLTPIGIDLRQHGMFASAVAYAILEREGQADRVIRTTCSSYKVDAVRGAELWKCFEPWFQTLAESMVLGHCLEISDGLLLPAGDLVLGESLDKGPIADPFAAAARTLAPAEGAAAQTPVIDALDRHAVQIAEPVYLTGFEAKEIAEEGESSRVDLVFPDGGTLAVDPGRLAASSVFGLGQAEVLAAREVIGLIRQDAGRWSVQVLATRAGDKKRTTVFVGPPAAAAASAKKGGKKKGPDTLTVLRERAGRLLRKKV